MPESSPREFEYESLHDLPGVIQQLRALTNGLESGELRLVAEGNELNLRPSSLVELQVRGKKSGTRSKLSFRLSWRSSDATQRTDGNPESHELSIQGK